MCQGQSLQLHAMTISPELQQLCCFGCTCSDPTSPWNFALTPQNIVENVKVFGISGSDHHHGAMKRPGNKTHLLGGIGTTLLLLPHLAVK